MLPDDAGIAGAWCCSGNVSDCNGQKREGSNSCDYELSGYSEYTLKSQDG